MNEDIKRFKIGYTCDNAMGKLIQVTDIYNNLAIREYALFGRGSKCEQKQIQSLIKKLKKAQG